ncbi:MAG: h16 [Verrucomicrobiaceae bacterium]|nr:h16 [Verrucomicrobiaceae bacterium]
MLNNKTIVITGANGGLGRAVADRALALGAKVILLDIAFAPEQLAQHEKNISRHAVNLADAKATQECFDGLEKFDALFNLAGGFDMGPRVFETTDAQWNHLFALNVGTLQNAVRAAVPKLLMQGRGAIVNVGALGALKGAANMSTYCASKSVVMRLTESLAEEVKNNGINVNAVLPSVIDTARNRADMPDADFIKWVAPEDLANVICFLASDFARAINGALIPVAGLS